MDFLKIINDMMDICKNHGQNVYGILTDNEEEMKAFCESYLKNTKEQPKKQPKEQPKEETKEETNKQSKKQPKTSGKELLTELPFDITCGSIDALDEIMINRWMGDCPCTSCQTEEEYIWQDLKLGKFIIINDPDYGCIKVKIADKTKKSIGIEFTYCNDEDPMEKRYEKNNFLEDILIEIL